MRKLRFFLAATWLWIRQDLHDFDLSKEPETQKRFRRWVVRGVRAMEFNPHTQWKYHLTMTWFWIANFLAVTIWLVFFRQSWETYGVFYVAIASVYANAVSDFTGVHAAWAALRGDQISIKQGIVGEDVAVVTEVKVTNGDLDD